MNISCIRSPVSIDDARAVIEACAGPNWRDDFMLGLEAVALVVIVVGVVIWIARQRKWT